MEDKMGEKTNKLKAMKNLKVEKTNLKLLLREDDFILFPNLMFLNHFSVTLDTEYVTLLFS